MGLSELDRRIINRLSGDLPSDKTPFAALAREVGLSERELLERIEGYFKTNLLRRVVAVVAHMRAGFAANAMVVWRVPEDKMVETAREMAGFKEVSHCYERLSYPHWPYTIYTMIHGRSRDQCIEVVERMSACTGMRDYTVFFTVREFKKESMRYFHESTGSANEDVGQARV